MTDIHIGRGQVSSGKIQLQPGEVTTVTVQAAGTYNLEVISDGVADAWYTNDGSTPTVNGTNCYLLPKGAMSVDPRPPLTTGTITLRLISEGTPTVVVQRDRRIATRT